MKKISEAHVLITTAVLVLTVAGCGSGEGSEGASAAPESSAPEVTETADDFAERFVAASAASVGGDCDAVDDFNRDAGFTLPCKVDSYDDLEVAGTDEIGPVAIVDFTDDEVPDGATAIAAVGEDGRFQLMQTLVASSIGLSSSQVGTEPEDQELRDEAVADFVEAIREEDCDAWYEVALTTMSKKRECRIEFDPESLIQPQIAAAQDAMPEPIGGTEAFGFHGLDTGDNYRVLLTVRQYGPEDDPGDLPYLVVSYRSR